MELLPVLDEHDVRLLLDRMKLVDEGVEVEISFDERHSNSLAKARFPSGRILVIKRARYIGMASRFDTSVVASRLIGEGTRLLTPRYLELPDLDDAPPVLVYWWIPSPTLSSLWPELDGPARARALVGCGQLLRELHEIRLQAHGPLLESESSTRTLITFLTEDLHERLHPAIEASWPGHERTLERLDEAFSTALEGRDDPSAVLVHNDLFSANVLCEANEAGPKCVGVLDFEDAISGPAEADLAKTEILHGPLFGRELTASWFENVLDGYSERTDAQLLAVFRAYHLLNMGYHAALIGLHEHAEEVGRVVDAELDQWQEGLRHQKVFANSSDRASR